MTFTRFIVEGWSWSSLTLIGGMVAAAGCAVRSRLGLRPGYFAAALLLALFTLLPPFGTLAAGVLFSAHMAQHILLLVVIPALLVLSLPRDFTPRFLNSGGFRSLAWVAGVGPMWLWHTPALCEAAVRQPAVHAVQTASLMAMGLVFWWPVLAPCARNRMTPGPGIVYLFTACLACTALGIILTLTPADVCPIFSAPSSVSFWTDLRGRIGAEQDRQIGGLLMWIPMCLIYLGAILLEVFRWLRPTGVTEKPPP
ncbi:MAG: cytochrome c oxidase assembly protein [Verrucomicrobia bacterium]|nr:cytochrome c oxidase assembly protein [Verrucomicrobiota bacterium]